MLVSALKKGAMPDLKHLQLSLNSASASTLQALRREFDERNHYAAFGWKKPLKKWE